MFEDSLFASNESADTKRGARRRRWFALASVGVQGLVLTGFVVVPMVWPETLPPSLTAPKMLTLTTRKPEPKVQPKQVHVETTNSAAMSAPSAPTMVESHRGGVMTPIGNVQFATDAPSLYVGGGEATPSLASILAAGVGAGPGPVVVAVAPRKAEPLNVSQGVSKGLLLAPIQPTYPRIAVAAKIEGTVVVTATINKEGRITGLHVLSGPDMLRTAAVDAVQDARYRPYLLNGQPTEVITTVSVTFRLGA